MNEAVRQPCTAWAEKLAATHPEDLSADERTELDAHTAKCPACDAVRAEYRLIDALILAYPSGRTSPDIRPPRLAPPDSRDCDPCDSARRQI